MNATFTDVHSANGRLGDLAGPSGLVLFTRDIGCPVSQRYMPTLRRLAIDPALKDYRIAVIDVTPHDGDAARTAAADAMPARTLFDPEKRISGALGAQTTAEVFVIDARGTLKYRGAIDDQFGITHQKAKPTATWLLDAVRALRAGEEPVVTRTEAPGCALAEPAASAPPREITYHNRISRIVQSRCESCHRRGGLAPMPLQSYREVYERRAAIAAMVGAGFMPPWSARKDIGHWANDRSLSERDKRDLLEWARSAAPQGDPSDAPEPRRFAAGWNIGRPDAIVRIPEEIAVPAQGAIEYKYVFAKTPFDEDKWVTAVEIRPTQPKAVHHVLVFIEEPGRRHLTDAERRALKPGAKLPPEPTDGVMGFFAATVPGSTGMVFPPGTGKKLPKGAWLRFEIHYQPNGMALVDRTEIGFKFSKAPLREVASRSAPNTSFAIPPNAPHYKVSASYKFTAPGELVSLFPHMHLRGSAFRFELAYPNGKRVTLLDVPRFDFNWQGHYEFAKPYAVPAGARLIATAWYDNSKRNPWNPDPSKTVRWGRQTYEEMMIGYFDFIAADAGHGTGAVKTDRSARPSRSASVSRRR